MTDNLDHEKNGAQGHVNQIRETMEYDVVIVGAGPAGLATACQLAKLNSDISVCIVEKSAEIGGHILSGAVLETKALDELFPDWLNMSAPLNTPVTSDQLYWLNDKQKSITIPSIFAPNTFHNQGNYIISLGNFCRWLGEQAENLGVDIFTGFAAKEILFNHLPDDTLQLAASVNGIIIGDMGIAADGSTKGSFTAGIELKAKYTIFAEGCRGHLGKQLIQTYRLDQNKEPQHYGLGIKELWQVPEDQHQAGLVVHTTGWPLQETQTGGGGFLYHLEDNQVAVGLITDLSYDNPYLSPFDEFQRYKHHPVIAATLKGAKRLSYGARALAKGGIQSQPEMVFPGGLLVGDNAGTLNSAKIKGTHTAMKSGMIAAETIVEALAQKRCNDKLTRFSSAYKSSWAYHELYQQRNFAPALHKWGSLLGGAYSFIDLNLFAGRLPWTLSDPAPDYTCLKNASDCEPINYPKPDNVLSFDKLSSVYLSNTHHEEDQPCHLQLIDPSIPININLLQYDEPAQRYCPAGVYEVLDDDSQDDANNGSNGGNGGNKKKRFQINAQNCVHCKTCDIKDPSQNIVWVTPEGAGGPNYPNM